MAGLWIALALAVWSALCVLAGGYYIHYRYTGRIQRLAADERATRRDRQFREARDLWEQQIERARAHTLAVTR